MSEVWKPIVGYESCYAVSTDGRAARTATYGANPKPRWKIIAQRLKSDGYVRFHLCVDGVRTDPLAHRLVWQTFCGPIPDSLEVNHKNSVRSDNRLENLELMTRSANAAYAFQANGRQPADNPSHGSKNGSAKLTEADIPIIFELAAAGLCQWQIAERFGVSQPAIGYVLRGESWRHVSAASDVVKQD